MTSILERLTDAQNRHDAELMASFVADDYASSQPVHPDRAFSGRAQVLANWTEVFAGIQDFRARMVGFCRAGDVEWGELDWAGHHTDGSVFAMRGVIIATIRDDLITSARLYMEPVDFGGEGIETAFEQLYRPPVQRRPKE